MNMTKSNIVHLSMLFFLLLSALLAVAWSLQPDKHFLMDDYTLLHRAIFKPVTEMINILPVARYNSRDFGDLFVKLLYDWVGYSNVAMHTIFAFMHVCNTVLAFKVARLLLEGKNSFYSALVVAGIFGIFPTALMAPTWIAAVYDLLCCTFVFLSLYCFLLSLKSDKNGFYFGIVSVLSYIISLRFKEMSLLLPFFFILYSILFRERSGIKAGIFVCSASFVWMIIYLVKLLSFPGLESGNVYHQTFNPFDWCVAFVKYIHIYFNFFDPSFRFTTSNILAIALTIILFIFWAIGLFVLTKRRDFSGIVFIASVGLILAPVLTLNQTTHIVYLYIPSFFIALASVNIGSKIIKVNIKKPALCVSLFFIFLLMLSFTPAIIIRENFWLNLAVKDAADMELVKQKLPLMPNTTVYVKQTSEDYSIFFPYPWVVQILSNDNTLKLVWVQDLPEHPVKPYVFWELRDGELKEYARDLENPS